MLAITRTALITATGDSAPASCAAMRAGLTRPGALPFEAWDPDTNETLPVTGHAVPMAGGFGGLARLAALGALAEDALWQRPDGPNAPPTGLFLCLPSGAWVTRAAQQESPQRPADELSAAERRADRLRTAAPARLVPLMRRMAHAPAAPEYAHVQLSFGDASGFATVLDQATAALKAGTVGRAVIGGIDSLVDVDVVRALAMLGLLKTPQNAVGVIPGEGAGLLVVEPVTQAQRRGEKVLGVLDGFFRETETPDNRGRIGRALARTVDAVSPAAAAPGLLVSDLDGTVPRAHEWGSAQTRMKSKVPRAEWHVAQAFGALGAATGPAAACFLTHAFARGFARDPVGVAWLWGEAGERVAFRISSPRN